MEIQDFDRVVQQYWPRILRFLLAAVQDSDVAETLTQDCFLRAYRSRHGFRGESSLNTWLMTIAVNLVEITPAAGDSSSGGRLNERPSIAPSSRSGCPTERFRRKKEL